jgi:hypothetical protein
MAFSVLPGELIVRKLLKESNHRDKEKDTPYLPNGSHTARHGDQI